MNTHRKMVLSSVMAALLACLTVGCDNAKQKESKQVKAAGSVSSITGVAIHPDDYGQLVVAFSTRTNEQSFADEPTLYLTKNWKVKAGKLSLIENY